MKIQTSYFASKAPALRKVCIAKWHRNWRGPREPSFAPSNPKAEDWAGAYRADLEARFPDAPSLEAALREVCKKVPEPILCCFEADPAECHRSVLAEFVRERLGLNVEEWQPEAKRPREVQGRLV